MKFIEWLVWFLWTCRRCKHEPGPWNMREMGMGKIRSCTKCGKTLDLI